MFVARKQASGIIWSPAPGTDLIKNLQVDGIDTWWDVAGMKIGKLTRAAMI